MPDENRPIGEPRSLDDLAPGELDQVEARAAALLEQIAAQRSARQIHTAKSPADDVTDAFTKSAPAPEPATEPATEPEHPAAAPVRRLAPPPWQMHSPIGSRNSRNGSNSTSNARRSQNLNVQLRSRSRRRLSRLS